MHPSQNYAPLWVKSHYSFLEGASSPAQLVDQAHAYGLPAIALTDRDGVYGLVRAHVRAKELGIKLIAGAQVSLGGPSFSDLVGFETTNEPALVYDDPVVLLAQSRAGYAHLTRLLSKGHLACEKGVSRVSLTELANVGPDVLALVTDPELLPALAPSLRGRLYALCTRHHVAGERGRERAVRDIAGRLEIPVVAGTEVLYHERARRPLQDIVTCIRHGRTLHQAAATTKPNDRHALLSATGFSKLFADDPAAVARTLEINERCTFNLTQLNYRYPAGGLGDQAGPGRLRTLAIEGARGRYGGQIPEPVARQLDRELALIDELDYGGYFLTMWEIVQFCRREGILCQGRGSAANSAVCFCLGITAVDPVRMDLLFERFISRERAEPPDIDLDIEHRRREEVIAHVYTQYGRRNAAMVATFIRYRPRSVLRDLGKVFDLPAAAIDRAARLHDGFVPELQPEVLVEAGLDIHSPSCRHLLTLGNQLLGAPRHLATHPGGFILGHTPVDTLAPIEPAAMPGRTVIQWDKNDVEDLGLFKVDLLGLGALHHLHLCFDLLQQHQNLALSMASVPGEDPATYAMMTRADTVGVFQIESRAQMAMLPRVAPKTFYDLVVEIALVRPGPIQGEMVHPYLRRRCGEEPICYPHPTLERVLGKTLGVPLFQEQVMRLAMLTAGYSPGEADQLRRDMTAWQSQNKIEQHRERLTTRMVENGIDPEFAERVFAQIRGFGEYGFPESHAASFALITYVSAYLRCHHPAAFICGLLNAQPMGFYRPSTIVEDARRMGVEVRAIDVQTSEWNCTLEPLSHTSRSRGRHAIRMGLRYIQGFGSREQLAFAAAPAPYRNLKEFVTRTKLPAPVLQTVAEAGALSCFGGDRRQTIWQLRGLARQAGDSLDLGEDKHGQRDLFAPLSQAEEIVWDYQRTSHSTRGHPMSLLRRRLRALGLVTAKTVRKLRNGQAVDYVGMVLCRQRPTTASGVTFYTLEDETGFVNLVVWGTVFQRYEKIGRTLTLLGISGKIQATREGVVHIIVDVLWDPRNQIEKLDAPTCNIRKRMGR
ncbi:MAG: error-prone DNA polymerase, partial [Nannocystaceae bacterium]